jgi:probable addiction module antidote protein
MLKTKIKTKVYDSADYINSKEAVIAFLTGAIEENDHEYLLKTISNIARSEGMAKTIKELSRTHESLYKSLSADGNPSFETIMRVLDILGYKFSVEQTKTA